MGDGWRRPGANEDDDDAGDDDEHAEDDDDADGDNYDADDQDDASDEGEDDADAEDDDDGAAEEKERGKDFLPRGNRNHLRPRGICSGKGKPLCPSRKRIRGGDEGLWRWDENASVAGDVRGRGGIRAVLTRRHTNSIIDHRRPPPTEEEEEEGKEGKREE